MKALGKNIFLFISIMTHNLDIKVNLFYADRIFVSIAYDLIKYSNILRITCSIYLIA